MNRGQFGVGYGRARSGDMNSTARSLLAAVNETSVAARNGWLLFLALLTYLFIAASSVNHKDLLLNSPLELPILGIHLPLDSFFLFAPMVMLFVHFGLLVQHVLLSRKVLELDDVLREDETWRGQKTHPLRLELHSYYYTQALAGSKRSAVFSVFLHGMVWFSLVLLPVFLILYFQTIFLPYHDIKITWAHRIYLLAELIILAGVGIFLRLPRSSFWHALTHTSRHYAGNFFTTLIAVLGALFLSFFVVTIPGEWMDRITKNIEFLSVPLSGDREKIDRRAFMPTAWLFGDNSRLRFSKVGGYFHRNLIVTDEDLVSNKDEVEGEVSLSIRGRDLRYAVLNRTDLHRADLTGSDLSGAELIGANLSNARLSCRDFEFGAEGVLRESCVILKGANFSKANLQGSDLRFIDAQNAVFDGADLQGADFAFAQLDGSSFDGAKAQRVNFSAAQLIGANFLGSQLQGADLSGSQLYGSDFSSSELDGAVFATARLQGVSFADARMVGVDLSDSFLWGVDLSGTNLSATDFGNSVIWNSIPPEEASFNLTSFQKTKLQQPTEEVFAELETIAQKKASGNAKELLLELIEGGLSSQSNWQGGGDFQSWQNQISKFTAQNPKIYRDQYTAFLANLACKNTLSDIAIVNGTVGHALKLRFAGDVRLFYSLIQQDGCTVLSLIDVELRKQLIRTVTVLEEKDKNKPSENAAHLSNSN